MKAARSQRWRVGDRFYRPNPDPDPLVFLVTALTTHYVYFWNPSLDAGTSVGWRGKGPAYARRLTRRQLYRDVERRRIVRLPD